MNQIFLKRNAAKFTIIHHKKEFSTEDNCVLCLSLLYSVGICPLLSFKNHTLKGPYTMTRN